jgi:hypothetical protein
MLNPLNGSALRGCHSEKPLRTLPGKAVLAGCHIGSREAECFQISRRNASGKSDVTAFALTGSQGWRKPDRTECAGQVRTPRLPIHAACFVSIPADGPKPACGRHGIPLPGKAYGPGTRERPFRTIGKAAAVLQPGERVAIADGVYRGAERARTGRSAMKRPTAPRR